MYTHNRPLPRKLAAGAVVALALLAAACSPDSNGPSSPTPFAHPAPRFSASPATSSAPSLGTAGNFAVLGGPAVTCTNTPPPTTITGDVGVALSAAFTNTGCTIVGTVHAGDAAALAAYNDFLRAYDALADQSCDSFLTGTLDGVTLPPGVYCFAAAATLTGTLTLDGPSTGTWLFKIGTSGTGALTGTNFSVVMSGGGDPCNVTWWVAEAATMNTSNFIGTILAGAAITVTSGTVGTFDGRALAKAAVTITGGTLTGCTGGSLGGTAKPKCNQGVGNGPEGCDPGNSNNHNPTNDESGGTKGKPGRKGAK